MNGIIAIIIHKIILAKAKAIAITGSNITNIMIQNITKAHLKRIHFIFDHMDPLS